MNLFAQTSSETISLIVHLLNHFSLMSHFYTPSKRQNTFVFLTFSGGIQMEHWVNMN